MPYNAAETHVIYEPRDQLGNWAASRSGRNYHEHAAFVGLEAHGRIIAVAVYENYTGHSMQVSFVLSGVSISNAFIYSCFNYAFMSNALDKLITFPSGIEHQFIKGLGFVDDENDPYMKTMTVGQCRFLVKH